MKDKEFNLLDEPWIVVLSRNGTIETIGLKEVFQRADEFEGLAGDSQCQDIAVMRFLLAILYATHLRAPSSVSKTCSEEATIDRWKSIWEKGNFKDGTISDYLEGQRDRFWLFHPDFPFFQSIVDKGTKYDANKLIGDLSESSNKPRLFSNYGGVSKRVISYGDAARWLLYINGFDDTSVKPSVRKAGLSSTGVGWLGKLGLVYIKGRNLFETLTLNFVLTDHKGEPFPDGKAIWERSPTSEERVEIALPRSPIELLTMQSRRILLNRNDGGVTGFLSLGGDIVRKENAFTEQMTLWERTDDGSFVPKRHDPSKSAWRDFSAIIAGSEENRLPGTICWSKTLENEGIFPYDVANFCIVGVKYAEKGSCAEDTISDSISLNSKLLSELGNGWNARISELLTLTEKSVRALASFAKDLCELNGYNRNKDKKIMDEVESKVSLQAFFNLDDPFRHWLSSIDPEGSDSDSKSADWKNTVYFAVVENLGHEMLEDAGIKAFVGRADSKVAMKNNVFSKFSKFRNTVIKILKEGKS
ncbi:type I-E CRISPR-associated protein Cse1/CasA [Methanomassiliicoccaceae archaeon COG_1]|nr:type I-E CRISPR-associated protein Cse1/CasA [Methanomassiliicoccaceae archaeon COG_1]